MTMSKKRIHYSSKFKGKLVLIAIRGDETVSQLAARYNIYPTQINSWKWQLIEQDAELFSKIILLPIRSSLQQMTCTGLLVN
jgi:transposase